MAVSENPNFTFLEQNIPHKRGVALQGGTRSGKTYSALRWIIKQCVKHKGMRISIVRASLPALKGSAMSDFFEILKDVGLYSEANHNMTENTYELNGNVIEFFSVDNEQKIRGPKRHILYCNEANELGYDKYIQLALRTEGKIILDYNPSMFTHWIYDKVLPLENWAMLVTTYKDNPHLTAENLHQIESMKDTDPDLWRVFGEGQRGNIQGIIFTNWCVVDRIPEEAKRLGYGMDFGFTNDPTALVDVYQHMGELWVNEIIYERALTNQDIASRMDRTGVPKAAEIIADSSEPKSIEEIYRMGFNVKGALKGPGSINSSIDILKRYRINVTSGSRNLIGELRTYKWKSDHRITDPLNPLQLTNEPVDYNNHAIDALRYLALNKLMQNNTGKYAIAIA